MEGGMEGNGKGRDKYRNTKVAGRSLALRVLIDWRVFGALNF
jgi:hypothetical protein